MLAHNANRTVPDYFEQGVLRPRASVATMSSAMDVGNPSNLERLVALFPDPAAMRTAKEGGSLLPPKHILNAPTKLMKSEGYGGGYDYDHEAPDAFSGQDYFPDALGRQTFYDPPDRGFEREIRKRLDYWAKLRRERG